MQIKTILGEKLRESVGSVLPIALIVALLCLFFVPISTDLMLAFVIAVIFLIVGMGLFTLGTEASMTPIGNYLGSRMTKSKKLGLIIVLSFILGVAITVAEPDLQVLANNVPHINTYVLMLTVSVGVGFFLVVSMLRILLAIDLKWLLIGFYVIVFIIAAFSDPDFLSVAFDSGGVTTGPMTVPFIMALGVGVAAIRSDKNAESDSFGLVGLCSIGPILAVLILGFIYEGDSADIGAQAVTSYADTVELGTSYLAAIPHYMSEVALALAPIVVIFLVFQVVSLKLRRLPFMKIVIGIIYTYVGLVLFLTGVNVGFSSIGTLLGQEMAASEWRWMLVPVAMVMGWFIIRAEPAVHVLNKQVEEMSAGAISEKAMGISLSAAIAVANGLAMVRVLTGINILWFLLPGYVVALALSFLVPKMFTAIAFDSGGVASGPMTATFMLPLAMGAADAVGGNVMTDAFGLVAMVAMTPLITVQIMGAIYKAKAHKESLKREAVAEAVEAAGNDVIELWEVAE